MRAHWVSLLSAFATGLVFGYAALPVVAQSQGGSESARLMALAASREDPPLGWTLAERSFKDGNGRLFAVRGSGSRKRSSCRVEAIEDQGVTCRHGFKREFIARKDIETLVRPAETGGFLLWFSAFLASGAGALTAACLIGMAMLGAAIPLAILGAFLIYMGFLGGMLTDDQ